MTLTIIAFELGLLIIALTALTVVLANFASDPRIRVEVQETPSVASDGNLINAESNPALDTGLYHPDADDMYAYLDEKVKEMRRARRDPYEAEDWNEVARRG